MHTVLLIDEVLRLILDNCWGGHEPRQTLATLARCCKAWKDPALDTLWSSITTLAPLLALKTTKQDVVGVLYRQSALLKRFSLSLYPDTHGRAPFPKLCCSHQAHNAESSSHSPPADHIRQVCFAAVGKRSLVVRRMSDAQVMDSFFRNQTRQN